METRRNGMKALLHAEKICEAINKGKTVNVVSIDGMVEVAPIVRCKDCKHYLSGRLFNCAIYNIAKGEKWFCADGETKEKIEPESKGELWIDDYYTAWKEKK